MSSWARSYRSAEKVSAGFYMHVLRSRPTWHCRRPPDRVRSAAANICNPGTNTMTPAECGGARVTTPRRARVKLSRRDRGECARHQDEQRIGVTLDQSTGLAVTVYSPPMTGIRPELPGSHRSFEIVNPVVAQWETSNNWDY